MADLTGRGDLVHGIELARQGSKDAAYTVLQRALFTEGDSAPLRSWLAAVAPNPVESLMHLERAAALDPENPKVQSGLAWARGQLAAGSGPLPPPGVRSPDPATSFSRGEAAPGAGGAGWGAPPATGEALSNVLPGAVDPATANWMAALAGRSAAVPTTAPPGEPAASLPATTAMGDTTVEEGVPAPPPRPLTPLELGAWPLSDRDVEAASVSSVEALPGEDSRLADPAPWAWPEGQAGNEGALAASREPGAAFVGAPIPDETAASPEAAPAGSLPGAGGSPAGPVQPHRVGEVLAQRTWGARHGTHALVLPAQPGAGLAGAALPAIAPPPFENPRAQAGGTGVGMHEPLYQVFAGVEPAGGESGSRRKRWLLPAVIGVVGLAVLLVGLQVVLRGSAAPSMGAQATAGHLAATTGTPGARGTAPAGSGKAPTVTLTPDGRVRAAGQQYANAVTALVGKMRPQDAEIVNTMHQAETGVLSAKAAATRMAGYTGDNTEFETAAGKLVAPPAYQGHLASLTAALDARGRSLQGAASYVKRLGDLQATVQAAKDAENAYRDAQTAYNRQATSDNYVQSLKAKQSLDHAQDVLTRLQTYLDQDHQQFTDRWREYNEQLPPVPPAGHSAGPARPPHIQPGAFLLRSDPAHYDRRLWARRGRGCQHAEVRGG